MKSLNDAPEPMEVPGTEVPLVPVQTTNEGFTVESLTSKLLKYKAMKGFFSINKLYNLGYD